MSAGVRAPGGSKDRHRVLWMGGIIILLPGSYGTYGFVLTWPEAGVGRSEHDARGVALQNAADLLHQGVYSTIGVFRRDGLLGYNFGLGHLSPESQVVLGHRAVGFLALICGLAIGAGAVQMGIRYQRSLRNPRPLFSLIATGLILNLVMVVLYVEGLPAPL